MEQCALTKDADHTTQHNKVHTYRMQLMFRKDINIQYMPKEQLKV